eukprot:CAMPEP_0197076002 /NCGR_PEP_ID=MMETSP1384-20130603/211896_1 /TAXON_ID=29189 /ORGANISM="Ammonia sp." /LENGTH=110 /DNA_ID=CAMNT_0042514851 /DNA_START=246 /DNA_END=578 /DNA_ORIENTATION=-
MLACNRLIHLHLVPSALLEDADMFAMEEIAMDAVKHIDIEMHALRLFQIAMDAVKHIDIEMHALRLFPCERIMSLQICTCVDIVTYIEIEVVVQLCGDLLQRVVVGVHAD